MPHTWVIKDYCLIALLLWIYTKQLCTVCCLNAKQSLVHAIFPVIWCPIIRSPLHLSSYVKTFTERLECAAPKCWAKYTTDKYQNQAFKDFFLRGVKSPKLAPKKALKTLNLLPLSPWKSTLQKCGVTEKDFFFFLLQRWRKKRGAAPQATIQGVTKSWIII